MKYLLVLLSLTFFSSLALAERCMNDDQCSIIDSNGYNSCFLVETGISTLGVKTCRVQCLPIIVGVLCIKQEYRPVGRCVDYRLDSPYSWNPESGCAKALSPSKWKRILKQY